MRRLVLGPVLAAVGSGLLLPGPAGAADTAVTFSVAAGALTISAPASAALSNATATVLGTSVSGQLGTTTVTDDRALAAGSWTVTVSATDFTAGSLTIAKGEASAYSGVATSTTGTLVFVPTTALSAVNLGAPATIASATGVLGAASVTYNPTVTVTIARSVQAGSYSGTVTQTVA